MIALKALLFAIGLSVFGTIVYLVLYFRWFFRMARQTVVPAGTGWDLVSQVHNTIYTPAYWLLMVGLFSTGMAIVFLWPGPVFNP